MPAEERRVKETSEQEVLKDKAVRYVLRLGELFETKCNFIEAVLKNEERRKKIVDRVNKCLLLIPTQELVKLTHKNPAFQEFLIKQVFLVKEDALYRANTDRVHAEANWSDKLMSLVGSLDGRTILTGVKNHKGDVVRTKSDLHYKASEASETLSIHGEYLDRKGEKPLLEVLAEIADIVYNLTQLLALDKNNQCREKYEKYLCQIDETYQTSRTVLLSMVIAKYHHRMYVSKDGKNAYTTEDELIGSVTARYFPKMLKDPAEAKRRINRSYKLMDGIFVKLRSIMLDKFIVRYDSLDEQTQHILRKVLKDMMKKLAAFAEIESLAPTVAKGLAEIDLESLDS